MSARWKVTLVVLLTAVMAALVLAHVRGINGQWYWWWAWRRLPFWPLYPAMLVAAAPFAVAQLCWSRGRRRLAVACLFSASLFLMLAALACQPPTGLRRLPVLVQNSVNTSYYLDASILHEQELIGTRDWLYMFPDILPLLHVHARFKPPGLMLYYLALIALFGKGTLSATIGGLGVALMACASVPATYAMLKRFGEDADEAFCGASYLALCPSLLLFLPQFDQVYVLLTALILMLYAGAVLRPGWRSACAFGGGMALLLFLSYIFLIFGLFFVAYWMVLLADRGATAARRAAATLILAAAVCAACYGALWAYTGFDPIKTFHVISRLQAADLVHLERPFPRHMIFDVIDFAMSSAYVSFVLIAFYLAGRGRTAITARAPADRLIQIGLLQIVTVAAAALLPGETARLWMLMFPLLMAPIGRELATWTPRRRAVVYACVWLMVVVICQNMIFLYMGPEIDGPRAR